jgi:hypothetical protein
VAAGLAAREEVLVLAVAADRVGAAECYLAPERLRDAAVARLAGQLAVALGADRFRDLGVRVQTVEPVLAPRQWVEDGGSNSGSLSKVL